jgi:hypothetical protein
VVIKAPDPGSATLPYRTEIVFFFFMNRSPSQD